MPSLSNRSGPCILAITLAVAGSARAAPPARPTTPARRRVTIDLSPLAPTDVVRLSGSPTAPISLNAEGQGLSLDDSGALALTGSNGHPRWTILLGNSMAAPAIDERDVSYVATRDGQLFAVDVRGQLQWSAWLPGQPVGGAVLAAGWVAAATRDGVVAWLSTRDGHAIATLSSGAHPSSAPIALADRALAVPTIDGEVIKLDRKGILWRRRLANAPVGLLATDTHGDIFATAGGDQVARIAADGTLCWRREVSASVDRSPVLGDDATVYIAADKTLLALDAHTGERRWAAPFKGRIVGGPIVADDHTLYVSVVAGHDGAQHGDVIAVREDGSILRTVALAARPLAGLNLAEHLLWVGLSDGTIQRLQVESTALSHEAPWPKARGGVANDGATATLRRTGGGWR